MYFNEVDKFMTTNTHNLEDDALIAFFMGGTIHHVLLGLFTTSSFSFFHTTYVIANLQLWELNSHAHVQQLLWLILY